MPLRSPQTRAQVKVLREKLSALGFSIGDDIALQILNDLRHVTAPTEVVSLRAVPAAAADTDSNGLGLTVDDVWAVRPDLARDEARAVLAEVERYYDPTQEQDERELATAAHHLFPKHRFIPAWIRDNDAEVAIDLCTGRVYDCALGAPQELLYPQYYHLTPITHVVNLRVGNQGHVVSSAFLAASMAVRHQVFELAYYGQQASSCKVQLGAFGSRANSADNTAQSA